MLKSFDAKSYVKPGVTLDQVLVTKQAFDFFDTDQTNSLSIAGITATIKSSRRQ